MISALVRGALRVVGGPACEPVTANQRLNLHKQNMKTTFLARAFAASAAVASFTVWAATASEGAAELTAAAKTFADRPYFCATLAGGDDRANDAADPAYSAALADSTLMAASFADGLEGLRKACASKQSRVSGSDTPSDPRQ